MALDLLLTTGGIAIVLLGGYLLVASAVTVALGFGLSRAVVGATVVAFGTSAPELTVGLSAVLRGSDGVTVGDVMGSCIGNVGLVLGEVRQVPGPEEDAHPRFPARHREWGEDDAGRR